MDTETHDKAYDIIKEAIDKLSQLEETEDELLDWLIDNLTDLKDKIFY